MKILNRIYFILLVAIVYCASLNYAQSSNHIQYKYSEKGNQNTYFFESSNDLDKALPSEKINVINVITTQFTRINHENFVLKDFKPETHVKNSFFVVFKICQIISIPFQETDIIFPFNYFW